MCLKKTHSARLKHISLLESLHLTKITTMGQCRCPLQISVPDLATESVLKAFCKALKIKLVKERLPLRDLNDAWEYLHNYTMDM